MRHESFVSVSSAVHERL